MLLASRQKEKRLYASLDIGIALGLDLEGTFAVSIGQKYAPEEPASPKPAPRAAPYANAPGFGGGGLPGTILAGNMRVLIG